MAKYPDVQINKNSFSVGFYTARKKLGTAKKVKKATRVAIKKSAASRSDKVDMSALQSAAKFLREVGGPEKAIEAIKLLASVQMN